VALFSQDDDSEDETPEMGSAFSGGQEPSDPDEVSESPVPEAADQADEPEPAAPDDANAYAQSPDDPGAQEEPTGEEPFPGQDQSADYVAPESESAQDSGSGPVQLPAMPQYVDNLPNYQALEKEIANFKPSDYKPSIGRRIAAALSGGAVAFGSRNPEAGLRVANQVNDAPLNRARAAEQQTEQGTRQQIADVNAQNQTRQAVYQNQRVAANDAALNTERQQRGEDYAAHAVVRDATIVPQSMRPVDPKNPLGEWQGTDVKGRPATNLAPPAQFLNSPAGKAAQAEKTISDARAAGHPFTPEQEQVVRSGGHLTVRNPTNIRVPSAESDMYRDARETFKSQHGRYPQTTAEENEVTQTARGTLKDGATAAQDIVDAANGQKESYAQQFTRNQDGTYTNISTGAIIPGQEFNAKIDGFRTAANVRLQKQGYQIDPQGNFDPIGQSSNGQPAQQQAAPQQQQPAAPPTGAQQGKTQSGQSVKVGDPITYNGKTGIIAGFTRQGKIIPKWN